MDEAIEILRKLPSMGPAWHRQTSPDIGETPEDVAHSYLGAAEGRNQQPLFDAKFYLEQNPDVAASGMHPLTHYVMHGAREGRDPHPLFDTSFYLARNPEALASGMNPLAHYILRGAKQGCNPHPLFDTNFYLAQNPDMAAEGINPLVHYVLHGAKEGRNPHPLFDTNFYLAQKPEVGASGLNPLVHFIFHGAKAGLDPHSLFKVEYYLAENPDVAKSGMNPLAHYILHGAKEGWDPYHLFDAAFYLRQNPDVAASGENPLLHYIFFGVKERRDPWPSLVVELDKKPPPLTASAEPTASEQYQRNAAILSTIRSLRAKNSVPEDTTNNRTLRPDEIDLCCAKLSSVGADEGPSIAAASSSMRAARAPADSSFSVVEFLMGLGITPDRTIGESSLPLSSVPILQRYNFGRLETTRRFDLEPSSAGTIKYGPTISILVPVYKPPISFLERAILSVLLQTYANWELILVDDFSQRSDTEAILQYYQSVDPRVKVHFCGKNGGISAATNVALTIANGSYVGLLDHDDMLTRDALEKVAAKLAADEDIDLVYTDECWIDRDDVVDGLFHKPDWSPLLLLNCMYTGHLSVYRTSLVKNVGGFRSEFDLSQDYDLALRVAERQPKVVHIDECLYGWRMIPGSAASGGKPTARLTNIAALQDAADRRGYDGVAIALPTANRVKRRLGEHRPLVSIVVPSDNLSNIRDTVNSIISSSTYENFEILVVTNSKLIAAHGSQLASTRTRLINYDEPYNFSDKCNVGASRAKGEQVVFFNDDVRVISPDWIETLLEYLTLPGVGVVGPKLIYDNGLIQHAGMVTGTRRFVGTAFHAYPADTTAYFNFAQSVREVSLICGACLAMPIQIFREVGGFDARNVPISHSDVDLCFRVRESERSCIYTPHASLTHIGHLSIGSAEAETSRQAKPFRKDKADLFLLKRWGRYLERDPYFPPKMRDLVYIDSQEPFHYFPTNRTTESKGPDVLIFSHDLSGSGAPKVVFDVAQVLIEQGCFVVVITPEGGPIRDRLLAIGAQVILDPLALSGNSNITDLGKNFDLIIANTVLCWPILKQLSPFSPIYWYIHESELTRHMAENNSEFLPAFKYATGVWTGSAISKDYLSRYDVDSVILEYGVEDPRDSSRFWEKKANPNEIIISVLATYEQRKGQDLAVLGYLAMPEAHRKRCRLRLAGRTNEVSFRSSVEATPNEHGMSGSVDFAGELDFESYLERLADSDIVLCPSRDDTLPLVSLNALAEGKILVCSRETGTSKYIQDGVSGFVLARNHPDEIAATLTRVVDNIHDWPKIGREARKVFLGNFSHARFRSRLLEALDFDFASAIDDSTLVKARA